MIGTLERVASRLHSHRRLIAMLVYGAVVLNAYAGAFLLRFELTIPATYRVVFMSTVLPLLAIRMLIFRLVGLSRERWRFASVGDAARLLVGVLLGTAAFYAYDRLLVAGTSVPVSVLGIEALLTMGFTAGIWLTYRLAFEHIRRSTGISRSRRIVIVGAGDAGNMLAREMLRSPARRYHPVAFVDDDRRMRGASVQGIPVLGTTAELASVAALVRAEELVICVPSAPVPELRRIVTECERTRLPFKVLPGISDVIEGRVSLQQLREVRIEDLLGRDPVLLELPELADDLSGRTVLITGAAGSIGAELARQVAIHQPGQLVLVDQAESELFFLDLDLRQRHPDLHITAVVGDVCDVGTINRVFGVYRPQRVFHAAAYKHVPLMEANAREAIRNNVIGTWRVAETAGRVGCETFVLVSTDKAVRPTNVMGATKRLAELTVLELQRYHPGTRYGAVRFGNVLGSNGSVIPIFRRQLAEGLPLTVTHPEATRFFMTIPEAAQLILQASLLDQFRGHIVMLDMGEPVRILDLARNLLRLSGIGDEASRITFTGLRPGEKLHEELSTPDEEAQPTPVPKIRVLRTPLLPSFQIAAQIELWEEAVRSESDDELLAGFYAIFPLLDTRPHEYQPGFADRRAPAPLLAVPTSRPRR